MPVLQYQEVLANATLVLESGATLNITGNFENYGSIAADAGSSVALNGSLAQTISGSNNFGNLAINNANGVELAGATTVARLLNLQAGTLNTNGNLTLASDINGTAMVGFNGGGIAGQATVQRYMPDNSGEGWWQGTGSIATAYYRYFGSPVQGAYVGGFDAPSFTLEVSNASMFNSNWNQAIAPFPNFYMYDESRLVGGGDETFAKGWMVPTAATVLQPGEGFIANIADEEAASITGTLNTSDVTVNGITDGGLANSGWNLLGNPYAAPISADQFLADNSGMLDASVYVRMAVSQYGGTWQSRVNGISSPSGWDGTVGSMQGFFVKRKSGASGSSVTFSRNIASTSYTNPDFYRTKGQKEGVLRLALESNGHADEAVLYWEAGATEQFDSQFDALKVQYNPAGWPTLFAKAAGGEMQAIAGLPAGEQIVALGLWIPADGQHSFKVSSLDGFATSMDILLEDKANGQLIDLRKQSAYAFEAKKGMAEGRFAIHFKPAQVTGLEGEFVAFEAYSAGKTIYVRPGQSGAQLHQVALFDLAGRQVWSAAVQGGNQAMQWQTQLPKGIYVLKLTHSQGQQARRIPIE